VDVSDVADVSEEVHSASVFRVEVCRMRDAVYTQKLNNLHSAILKMEAVFSIRNLGKITHIHTT
jgi:hypothetical protein